MERVLIVAKTRMANGACVSGLVLETNKGIRLLSPNGSNQPTDTGFDIGQIWDLDFQYTPGKPPHIEDVRVYKEQSIGHQTNLRNFLIQGYSYGKGGQINYLTAYFKLTRMGKAIFLEALAFQIPVLVSGFRIIHFTWLMITTVGSVTSTWENFPYPMLVSQMPFILSLLKP